MKTIGCEHIVQRGRSKEAGTLCGNNWRLTGKSHNVFFNVFIDLKTVCANSYRPNNIFV